MRTKIRKLNLLKLWSAITGIALTIALVLTFLPMQMSVNTGGILSISLSQVSANPDWLTGWDYRTSHVINNATGAGTNYQVQIKAFYNNDLPYRFSAIGRAQPFTTIHYPSAWRYSGTNNRTYIAFGATASGTDYDLYVTYYDHTLEAYATPAKVADALLTDEHSCPAIMVDNNGYIHIFAATDDPNLDFRHYKSPSAETITGSWSTETDIEVADAGHCWAYPKLIRYGDTVWCIYSDHPSSVVLRDGLFKKSTDNGATWSARQAILVHGTDTYHYAFYPGNCEISSDATKIHMTWCSLNDEPGTPIRANDVYHAYLNTSDNHMYSANGTDLGTSISLPSEAESYCKVVDTGTDSAHISTIHLDSSGYPWIIYRKGASTTTSPGGTHTIYHTRWNGSAWTSPESITTTGSLFNWGDFIINSISDVDAYLTTGTYTGRGGDIEEWNWNGSSWSKVRTIWTQLDSGQALNSPMVPINYSSDFKLVFCEIRGTDQTTPLKVYGLNCLDQEERVSLHEHCRTDFGDVRFTDNDEQTELHYWMENNISSSYATFRTEVADSLSSNPATIYVYHGKADATTTSDITDTFIVADDGVEGSLTEAILGSAAFSHASGKYHIAEDSIDDAFIAGTILSDWYKWGEIQEFQPSSAGSDGTQIYFGLWDSATVANVIGTIASKAALRRFFILRYTAQTTTDANKVLVMYQNAAGTFYYWTGSAWTTSSTNHTVSGNLTFRIYSDGTNLLANVLSGGVSIFTSPASIAIASVKAFSNGKCLGWSEFYSDAYYTTQDIDNYFVRQYVSPEPTHGAWGSEEPYTVEVTNTPDSKDFGILEVSTTSNTTLTYFTLNNTGNCPVDVTIQGTDVTGGDDTWVLSGTATPGENIYGLMAGLDDGGTFDVVVNATANAFVSDLAEATTQAWGLKLYMPTSLSGYDSQQMAGTITLVASAS